MVRNDRHIGSGECGRSGVIILRASSERDNNAAFAILVHRRANESDVASIAAVMAQRR
jgi:hypothetical protein